MTTPLDASTAGSAQPHTSPHAHAAAVATAYDLGDQQPLAAPFGDAARADMMALVLHAAKREQVSDIRFAEWLPRMMKRLEALSQALGVDAPAVHVFGHRFDQDFATHVAPGNEHAVAMRTSRAIFLNRSRDLNAAIASLNEPATQKVLLAALADAPPAFDVGLSPAKQEEIFRALTVSGKADGSLDSPAHVDRNFLEHHRFHAALSDAYAPDSDVHKALQTSMRETLPAAEHEAADALLADWLSLRRGRALAVMELTRPDGALATRAAKSWAQERHTPAEVMPQHRPATVSPQAVVEGAKALLSGLVAANANAPTKAIR